MGNTVTIIVQDESWKKVCSFKYNDSDKKRKAQILKTLRDAYGVNFKIESDLDWLN